MSYGIDEAVDDAEKHWHALRLVREKYPDAAMTQLPDKTKVFASEKVVPSAFDAIADADGRIFLCPYDVVDGLWVYVDHWRWVRMASFVQAAEKSKGVHKAIMALLSPGTIGLGDAATSPSTR